MDAAIRKPSLVKILCALEVSRNETYFNTKMRAAKKEKTVWDSCDKKENEIEKGNEKTRGFILVLRGVGWLFLFLLPNDY